MKGWILCAFLLISFSAFAREKSRVLSYHTAVSISNDKLIAENTIHVFIHDKAGDRFSDVSIPYSRNDNLQIVEAVLFNSKGEEVRKLKNKEVTTRSYFPQWSFFEDGFVKEFKLKGESYPYSIRYSYRTTTSDWITIARWTPFVIPGLGTQEASLVIDLPLTREANMDFSEKFEYEVSIFPDFHRHRWAMSNFTLDLPETLSPPLWESIPHVYVVPKNFTYGEQGSFESWASFGAWVEKLNAGLDILPDNEKAKVDRLIQNVTDKNEIVQILHQYRQDNTRYINVSIDIGGLKPYPSSYVVQNKYGDCKALTIYMKALLNHAGIESYYTLVSAGENRPVIKEHFPAQQFNHVILCIPIGADTMWLENTENYLPPGYLGPFTSGRKALLVNGAGSALVDTPKLTPEDVLESAYMLITLDDEGNGTAKIRKRVRGPKFERYIQISNESSGSRQKSRLEQDIPLDNFFIEDLSFDARDPGRPELAADLSIQLKGQLRKIGDLLALKLPYLKLFKLEKPGSRKTPVRINYPSYLTDTVEYHLPFLEKYHVEIPENINIETKFGTFKEEYSASSGKIFMNTEFKIFAGEYAVTEYGEFFEFIESIKKAKNKSAFILKPI
jgi:hypothetical protein